VFRCPRYSLYYNSCEYIVDFEAVPVRVLAAFYERLTGVLRRLPAQPFEQALDRGADFSAGGFFVLRVGDAKNTFA